MNLYYNRARYLNPATGRFVTLNPFEGNPHVPLSRQSYLYASADPVNRIDPSGKFDLAEMMIDVAIAETVSAIATAALSTPYGQTATSFIADALLGAGFPDKVMTLAPSACIIGGNGAVNYGFLTAGVGLEVLVGLRTLRPALYLSPFFSLNLGFSLGGSISGYAGAAYQTPDSSEYAGLFFTVTPPTTSLEAKIAAKLKSDAVIAALGTASAKIGLPPSLTWVLDALQSTIQGKSIDTAVNFVLNPAKVQSGSKGFTFSFAKTRNVEGGLDTPFGFGFSYSIEILRGQCSEDCEGGEIAPF